MQKILILLAIGLVSGCATVTQGTTEPVTFISDPNGAKMTTNAGHSCTTPCTIEIERDLQFTATFKLNNQTQTVAVATEYQDGSAATVAGTALLAPLILAPVALAVDAASGALLTHTPNPVKAVFTYQAELRDRALGQSTPSPASAPAAAPPQPAFPPVPGSPPLYEGSSYAAFTEDQIAVYCTQNWSTRPGPDGRTEYNPCTERSAFQ
ncbi:MAG: hypothetical protein AAGB15_13335 [Pseudomonadota bacterium]